MSKLEVEISGDVKKLKSAINDATGQLKGLAKQGVNAGKKVNRNALSAARGIKGLGNETVNAVPALNEFSRVIQDAPYGIQGVANNITELTTQFGYLTKKTGSSKAALKAMLGSLTGPAGILIAISAVTTLLVSFGDKLFSSSKKADKLKSSTKGVNDELKSQAAILKELIKNYGQFDKIRIISRFNTIKEREELKALNLNVLDYTQSEETRIRALKQLIKLYPRYFKGLDISQTNALIKAEDAVNKVLLRKQKLKQTLIKLEEATQKLENNLIELNKKRSSFNIKDIERVKVLDSQNLKLRDQIKLLREALELFVSYDTSFKELQNQKPIVVPITTGQPAELTTVDTAGSVAALQAQIRALKDEQAQVSKTAEQWKEYALQIKQVQDQIDLITKSDKIDLLGFTLADGVAKSIEAAKLRMQLALEDFNMAADQIIRNNIANTFAGIGEAIGNAMTGAMNLGQGLTKVLLGSMGNLLKQLGMLAISVGIGLEKIQIALASLNPKLAIAAGVALIAVGSAFKSGAAKIGGSMGTGSVAGGGSSGGFSSGTTFGSARPFSGNLTFTIRGTDLVAVLNSANSQNGIIGGNVSVG